MQCRSPLRRYETNANFLVYRAVADFADSTDKSGLGCFAPKIRANPPDHEVVAPRHPPNPLARFGMGVSFGWFDHQFLISNRPRWKYSISPFFCSPIQYWTPLSSARA